jgi:hypothetical protein
MSLLACTQATRKTPGPAVSSLCLSSSCACSQPFHPAFGGSSQSSKTSASVPQFCNEKKQISRAPSSAQLQEPKRRKKNPSRSIPGPGSRRWDGRRRSSGCDVDCVASSGCRGWPRPAQRAIAAPRTSRSLVHTRCSASPRCHSCSCIRPAFNSSCGPRPVTKPTLVRLLRRCLFPYRQPWRSFALLSSTLFVGCSWSSLII